MSKRYILVGLFDVAELVKTGVSSYKGEKYYYSTGSIKEINNTPEGKFLWSIRPSRANREVQIGDVLQAKMQATDKALFISDKELANSLFSTGFFQVRTNEEFIFAKFLYYFLRSDFFHEQKNQYATGSTQVAINDSGLRKIKFPLFSLKEQKRIADKLDKAFAYIDKVKARMDAIPELLKEFRKMVLSQAVSGKLTEEWRKERQANLKLVENEYLQIKAERIDCQKLNKKQLKSIDPIKEGGLFTEDWLSLYPEAICSPEKYSLGIGPFGSNLKVSDYTDIGVPLVFVRHIRANDFTGLNPKYISEEKFKELLPHSVNPDDLLITKMGDPPGDCEIYPSDAPNAVITSDCLKFRIWSKYYNRQFYKYVINSEAIKKQLGLITMGVAQQKISLQRFKEIVLPFPSLSEQNEIVNRIEGLFTIADKVELKFNQIKEQLQDLPSQILAKAFKGELVEPDLNDEPAEKLLERIKEEMEKLKPSSKRKKK